ncbi:MAG: hypothetical protein COW26_03910 [Nitrosopumilales archaeon CG15_BIG_FIL_POST_REV_8_21_14_020_33_23]|nr:MAG: hypothetical protein COW26_03910 [Nitrosopumilales archaeon CG15_BIG_FIL_POST_REV_8_21_14_020_33_23]PJB96876.1 MAG: hypothetical protein CO079_08900 [Nitrosopumilales archaeon CG_4_9_14_0_8_um_filter_34_10]
MEISAEEIIEINETPYQLFQKGVPNKATWITYRNMMKKTVCEYLKTILVGDLSLVEKQKQDMMISGKKLHYRRQYYDADFEIRVNELVKRAKADSKWIDSVLVAIASKLMDRTKLKKTDPDYIKSTMVENNLKPLKKLFSMVDVPIAWGKIDVMVNDENDIQDQSRGYTEDELETICKFCDPMERLMVKLGASSGIRAGAYDLNWGHIFKVYQIEKGKYVWEHEDVTESTVEYPVVCGLIRVYADSTSEYFGLVTPEWLDDLEIYKQRWIKETNQIPKDNDPLFKKAGPFVRRLSPSSIRTRMSRVVDESGVRVYIEGTKNKFNIPLFNGARRFFNKQNKKALTKTSKLAALIIKEYQMGHGGLIKLDKNYFKEQIEELIDEYLQTIPYITIDKTARKQSELESVKSQMTEMERTKADNKDLKKQMDEMETRFQKQIDHVLTSLHKQNPDR